MNKKFLLLLIFTLLNLNFNSPAKAFGLIYSGVDYPLDAAKAGGLKNNPEKKLILVSKESIKKPLTEILAEIRENTAIAEKAKAEPKEIMIGLTTKYPKSGTSSRTNFWLLVETGDAGILKAAENGHIKKIQFVDYRKERVCIPLGFMYIYYDNFITTVYGE